MLVGTGGVTARHVKSSSYPFAENQRVRRLICNPTVGCAVCEAQSHAFTSDPNFQSIGVKGLKVVLAERGIPPGRNQAENIVALQTCDDFSSQKAYEKAHVTQMMKKRGHVCLFGVKFHAELAHIERFWMWVKGKIRGHLTGKLAKLKSEIWRVYGQYTVLDARKAARHCRETATAYRRLEAQTDLGLCDLDAEETKVYTTHRRVFDANTATLMLAADMPMTDKDVQKAQLSATKKAHKKVRVEKQSLHISNIAAMFKRQKRAERSEDEIKKHKAASIERKKAHKARQPPPPAQQ